MEKEALNQALRSLIEKKELLSTIGYDDERYDEIEEELHDLEDTFNEEYGEYLEEVLEEVHTRIAQDSDVLLPTAYLPDSLDLEKLAVKTKKANHGNGVWIEADDYPNKEARLVLVANPPRLLLWVSNQQIEVWSA